MHNHASGDHSDARKFIAKMAAIATGYALGGFARAAKHVHDDIDADWAGFDRVTPSRGAE
jgi:hypothetical protein